MEHSLLIELIRHTRRTLSSIKKLTQLSQEKSGDREFSQLFYRMITKDIEKTDFLLRGFLNYLKVTTPIQKIDTVHTLIEEVLKKYQARLEEKGVKLLKDFEKDLPETIVPDNQLRYIFDFLLQYAIASSPSSGSIGFVTKSLYLKKEIDEEQALLKKDEKHIEILVIFTIDKKLKEQFGREMETKVRQEEAVSDFELQVIDDVVQKNKGMMKYEVDENKGERYIALRFPVERRKAVYYSSSKELD
jgi:signal transduction histidine kinase